jgi:hypothetical protein
MASSSTIGSPGSSTDFTGLSSLIDYRLKNTYEYFSRLNKNKSTVFNLIAKNDDINVLDDIDEKNIVKELQPESRIFLGNTVFKEIMSHGSGTSLTDMFLLAKYILHKVAKSKFNERIDRENTDILQILKTSYKSINSFLKMFSYTKLQKYSE